MVAQRVIYGVFCGLIMLMMCSCNQHKITWYQDLMNFERLSKYEAKQEKIAFIDTGIQKDLIEEYNIVDTYNVIDATTNVDDENGHGTAVVSLSAGSGYKGIKGLIPEAQIVVIKATDEDGRMTLENLNKALKYAQHQDVDVVNISLGGYKSDQEIVNRMEAMYMNDIIIVASAGDYNQKDLLFPANNFKSVLSVAAFDQNGELWEDSNVDDSLACAFPGTDISVLNNRLEIESVEGTSEASALASAYIIKLKAAYKSKYGTDMKSTDIFNIIKELGTLENGKVDYLKPFENL